MSEVTVVKKVPKGMVLFQYLEAHGTRKKNEKVPMHNSTAQALITHGIGKVIKEIKVIKKDNHK